MNDKERIDELEKRVVELAELMIVVVRYVDMLEDKIVPVLDDVLKATETYIKQVERHNQLLTQAFPSSRPNEN